MKPRAVPSFFKSKGNPTTDISSRAARTQKRRNRKAARQVRAATAQTRWPTSHRSTAGTNASFRATRVMASGQFIPELEKAAPLLKELSQSGFCFQAVSCDRLLPEETGVLDPPGAALI